MTVNCMYRWAPVAAAAFVLTACANSAPQAASDLEHSPASTVSTPVRSPSAPSDLIDADVSELESMAISLGVPVVITTSADAGAEYHLKAHPDGSVDFTGTAATESTRMTLQPAKVRNRTDKNKNHVLIVASPAIARPGPQSCVTDKRKTKLQLELCRPGDNTQSWQVIPAGDSGLFEISGVHTTVRVDRGKVTEKAGWSALQTIAVAP